MASSKEPNRTRTGSRGSRVPAVSIALMVVFLAGGTIGLLADWPAGPANLDWGVWAIVYGGYGYVIAAAVLHAKTGR